MLGRQGGSTIVKRRGVGRRGMAPVDSMSIVGLGLTEFVFAALALLAIVPGLWMFLSSFKSSYEIFGKAWGLPAALRWENYASAWIDSGLERYFVNSVFVTVISVTLILVLSAMATFGLTRLRFEGQELVLWLFIGGLMLPTVLVVIPLFLLLQKFGLLDNYAGLIAVYIAYSFPFTVFTLTPFFRAIPAELEEAVYIDGGSVYSVFRHIAWPLARPGLVIAGIFNVFGIWNEYVFAFTVLTSNEIRTLPVGIATLITTQYYQSDWGALFAGLVIAALPVVTVYLVWQRWLAEGIMAGAIKG